MRSDRFVFVVPSFSPIGLADRNSFIEIGNGRKKDYHKANLCMICTVAVFFVSALALVGQADDANPRSWSGVVINSHCSVDEAFAEAAKCTEGHSRAPTFLLT
jgi:hypothetical protein